METKKRCIFVLTKTNKIYIIMRTQNNNNRTQKKVLILIAILMGIFIIGSSIQILTNL